MIENYNSIENVYGNWPDFHDAEIISITLRRNKVKKNADVTVEMSYAEAEIINENTPEYEVNKRNDMIMMFEFGCVQSSIIEDFNYQNVIDELTISEDDSGLVVASFISIFGVEMKIVCENMKVLSVYPNK